MIARAHLERARGAGSDDPVLLLELQAADAAITRWLEHRPQEAGSVTIAALERARALAASTGPTEALEPRFQSAYERTLVLACVDAMQANEPEVILPLVEEMTRVAAGAGIEASLQASLRRGLGSHAPGSPRRSRGAARSGLAGGAPRVPSRDRSRHRVVAHPNEIHARPPDRGSGGGRRM